MLRGIGQCHRNRPACVEQTCLPAQCESVLRKTQQNVQQNPTVAKAILVLSKSTQKAFECPHFTPSHPHIYIQTSYPVTISNGGRSSRFNFFFFFSSPSSALSGSPFCALLGSSCFSAILPSVAGLSYGHWEKERAISESSGERRQQREEGKPELGVPALGPVVGS